MDSEDDLPLLDDDEDYYDDGDEGAIDDSGTSKSKNYTVLKGDDIRRRQEADIATISSFLSVSPDTARVLLSRHGWRADKVEEEWFADEVRVRAAAGVFDKPVFISPKGKKRVECQICFDRYRADDMKGASCGHLFCKTCWTGYITTAINDGPGCLNLRCPAINPPCGGAVGGDMVDMFASEDDRARYRRYLLRSYIEESKSTKWCPAPGCDFAVEIEIGTGSGSYDVTCDCSYRFCWNCTEENHRPVDCKTVSKWMRKNSSEAENTNWILANSKPCPKCKKPIEKNMGCMHMTCPPPCRHEFCWLCLGPWAKHGGSSFTTCNRYKAKKGEEEFSKAERRREMAKMSVQKYTHFYERWQANHLSRAKAVGDLEQMRVVNLEKLSTNQCTTITMLQFVIDAWEQIVECRRVLKWTYAYGYYLSEEEQAKVQLFEYLQGEAEAGLERLHKCAETELQSFLEGSGRGDDQFHDFRIKLTGLTKTTRGYFENLVSALENGLSGVDSSSRACKNMNKVKRMKWSKTVRAAQRNFERQDAVEGLNDDRDGWMCDNCGRTNDWSETRCPICRA